MVKRWLNVYLRLCYCRPHLRELNHVIASIMCVTCVNFVNWTGQFCQKFLKNVKNLNKIKILKNKIKRMKMRSWTQLVSQSIVSSATISWSQLIQLPLLAEPASKLLRITFEKMQAGPATNSRQA